MCDPIQALKNGIPYLDWWSSIGAMCSDLRHFYCTVHPTKNDAS